MKAFYKIENEIPFVGSGIIVPKGFTEYKVGQEPKELLDILSIENDTQRIQQIEAKCNQSIEAIYPIYKQINITNLLTPYTEEDRDIMKAFIDSKRAICHKAIADGTKAEDVDFSNES